MSLSRIDYSTAQPPIAREHVPTWEEWRKRHEQQVRQGLLARIFGRGQ
jgi:hypothetical protein